MNPDVTDPQPCVVRWALSRDLLRMAWIDSLSYANAWTPNDIAAQLRRQCVVAQVIEIAIPFGQNFCGDPVVMTQIAGYMLYELHRKQINVVRLCVEPIYRRRGLARAMLGKLVESLTMRGRNKVVMSVGERNVPAQLMLRACGFRATTFMRGRTRDDDGFIAFRFGLESEALEIQESEAVA